jgi:deazaflavin-dependent oxidoreductase (nitroreductase family)
MAMGCHGRATCRASGLGTLTAVADQSEPIDSAIDWVAEHTRKYVETGGEDGYLWRGFPTLVLTTKGRRSGDLRRNALIFGRDGDDYVLIASYGGRPKHPLWYLNLVADPHVRLQERATIIDGVAETVEDPAERARLWELMVSKFPQYEQYQANTERRIPVVRVRPAA